ncbi:flagellar assembly protein FliW [Bacillus luteolus]|uniref:Flagellar assembly factor FliW n=1 Tax=Litchfieldia luteola TaxID=682179 RepID=A0ABR9QEZ1_9BACI|nr:flagellar assembly protein FliW [Cytobacillus luteolus]MBE4907052.1 flagellar assembly protein FliW [Cytobacillus luteolus]MBP1943481.1 flagellar assembly factor FliW [Cytobacillus luteolus]
MKIQSKYHGEIEINESEIIQFEGGIPGFLEEKRFVIVPLAEEDSPLHILQSVETSQLAFVTTNPFTFFKDYDFEIPDAVVNNLNIRSEQDVAVLVILTVKESFEESTANLQAPIIINMKDQLGKQVVLNDPSFKTRHLLFNPKPSIGQEVK